MANHLGLTGRANDDERASTITQRPPRAGICFHRWPELNCFLSIELNLLLHFSVPLKCATVSAQGCFHYTSLPFLKTCTKMQKLAIITFACRHNKCLCLRRLSKPQPDLKENPRVEYVPVKQNLTFTSVAARQLQGTAIQLSQKLRN